MEEASSSSRVWTSAQAVGLMICPCSYMSREEKWKEMAGPGWVGMVSAATLAAVGMADK